MIIVQGSRKIKHKIVWFLADLNDFSERKLYIFEFFVFDSNLKQYKMKNVAILFEKNKFTNQVFQQRFKGANAVNVIEREKIRLLYTSDDIKISKKGKPCGWTYGDNVEIHNKKGQVIKIKQKRCDYFGQKETINVISC